MSTTTTVNFNLKNAGYANFADQTLTFRLLTAGADGSGDYVVLPGVVTATSDANGDGSITLFRNGVSDVQSIYEVTFPNKETIQFIIPSGTSTVELSNLIVNSQPTGSSAQQSSVFAEAIQRANHTGTQTLSTISDAGTIASQASNAVNIDGGAIDGVVIGANSAAAGTFTSISVSDGNITNAGDINCDSISSDAVATGLNIIFDGTDTGDNKITLTDNLASALDITESTNSYLKFTTTNTGEKIVFGKDLDISGDHDLIIGTSTGTKIGTATSQKIGFFNATPVVQQNGTGEGTGFTAGSGSAVKDDSTFTGNVGSTAYRINDIVKALKNLGILAQ